MSVRSSPLGSLAISAISVSNSPTAVPVLNSMNATIIVQLNLEVALGLGQARNGIIILFSRVGGIPSQLTAVHLAVQLRSLSLSSHNNHAALGNNLLLVCLVDVAGEGGDQQGGQDDQDDQDDDELYQSEALLVLHFANFLEHDKFLQ